MPSKPKKSNEKTSDMGHREKRKKRIRSHAFAFVSSVTRQFSIESSQILHLDENEAELQMIPKLLWVK